MKKKIAAIALALAALAIGLTGCGEAKSRTWSENGKLKVIATVFPYYDFVRQIAGDAVDVELFIPAGSSTHSFEPTPKDMIYLQEADLVIYNGGHMESFMDPILEAADGEGDLLCMMDYVEPLEELIVEGMEHEHEIEEHGHTHDHDEEGHVSEYDEHIWTSPKNAVLLVQAICDALSEKAPEYAGLFRENTEEYLGKLRELDERFEEVVADARNKIMIVGDRFPLRYFAESYGLDYRAAFSGCSEDSEPSVRTVAYLIDRVEEYQIPVVYHMELSSTRIADTIAEETGAKVLEFHSCHNVTKEEWEAGATYLELMEGNVEKLKEGLQ
ncbi:MAG TPA: zinc ABC transporter substrate-binding protein [Candidatus Fimimorpha excrementavium]|nr:zinc ABC transporter substrate-binding protein [Candidatus Fimimorpha excrementavium]